MVAWSPLTQLSEVELAGLFQLSRLYIRTHAVEKGEIEKVVWLRDPSGMLWWLV